MADNFNFNWSREPRFNPYMEVGDLGTMNRNAMDGYRPISAYTPNIPAEQAAAMNGYVDRTAQMQGYHPNALGQAVPVAVQPSQNEEYGAALQAASMAAQAQINAQMSLEKIDQQISANNARIALLKQELSKLGASNAYADEMDRKLAANRANVGDLANAQTHLGRIEARKLAEEQRKSAERLRAIEKMGKNGEFDDLMKIAKMRTSLEAVAKDPGLRSGLEREYNIAVQQYMNKYGHAPDFSNFENSVNLFYDRSGYTSASDEELSKDKSVLSNFVTNNTDVNGRWKGGDAELKRAIAAAEKQGNAELAKKLKNMWTPEQFNKMLADMNKEGETALDGLGTLFARDKAERDGKFTDKSNRKWEKKNGKWKSTDYKWNGKRNGV